MKESNKQFPKEHISQEVVQGMRELSADELGEVVGAGDPNESLLKLSQTQGLVTNTGDDKPIVLPELP